MQKSLQHWILQRSTAIILIPSIIVILWWIIMALQNIKIDVYNGTTLYTLWNITNEIPTVASAGGEWGMWVSKWYIKLIGLTIVLHMGEGVENVVMDYVHNEKTKYGINILIILVQIQLIKEILIFM